MYQLYLANYTSGHDLATLMTAGKFGQFCNIFTATHTD